MLDLVLRNKKGLVGDAMVGGSLDSCVHEMVEFTILHGRSIAISRIIALDFRKKKKKNNWHLQGPTWSNLIDKVSRR